MVDLKRVADRWEHSEWARGIPKEYWSHHPIIDDYINANIIPFATTLPDWLARNFLQNKPCERALSVCCGTGTQDRQALAAGVCQYLEGFDVSTGSLEYAQQEAIKAGFGDRVRYWVADVNTIVLPESHYDLALVFGALHHVDQLERLCGQLRRALKPGSLIFVNEYVGPPRFQWRDDQLEIINRAMAVLPESWRRTLQVYRIDPADVIKEDPSEATRSDEIIPILCDNFELVDYCDYGGALLFPLWGSGMLPDVFIDDSSADKQVIIKLMILMDELIAEHNLVPSPFAQLVLRNQPPVPGQSIAPNRLSTNSPDRNRWVQRWLVGTRLDLPSGNTYAVPPGVHLHSFQNRPLLSTPQGGHVTVDVPLLALWQAAAGRSLNEIISGFPLEAGLEADQSLPQHIKTGLACLSEAGLLIRPPALSLVETQNIAPLQLPSSVEAHNIASLPKPPAVTAVIVNYHSKEWLKTCIPSLLAQTYSPLEIIVVDNGSHDGALEWLETAYPSVRRLQIAQPSPLAHGLNAGAALASPGSYLLLLNPDLRLEPDAVAEMVRVAQSDPLCAAVAAKLRLSWAPAFLNGIGNQVRSYSFGTDNAIGHLDLGQFDHWRELPSACFAAALLTPAAWQAVGPVDEDFAMYYEDVEWCYRARLLGYKVLAAPNALVEHAFGGVIGPAGEKIPAGASEGLTPRKLSHAIYGRQRFIAKLLKPRYLGFLRSYLREDWASYRNYRRLGIRDLARAYPAAWTRLLKSLPGLLRQRASLQKRRQISDDALFALQAQIPDPLVWNNLPELTWELVTNLYTPLMSGERTRLMPEFTAPRRPHLLMICNASCPEAAPLAGQLHQQAENTLDITLATAQPAALEGTLEAGSGVFQQVQYAPDRPAVLALLIENCDVALLPGDLVRALPDLEYTQARLVISLHGEALRQLGLDEMHRMLHLGDAYFCPAEQRDFWLGALAAKGRSHIPLLVEAAQLADYCREGSYAPDRSPRPQRFIPEPVVPTAWVPRAIYFYRTQGLRAVTLRTLNFIWFKLTHPQSWK
mgnify:CR=1 FL=1